MDRNQLRTAVFYASRIVIILVVIGALIAIVWFVASLADETEEPVSGPTETAGIVEESQQADDEAVPPATADETQRDSRERRQTNQPQRDNGTATPQTGPANQAQSADLPGTGPEAALSLLAIPVFVYAIIRYRSSLASLNRRLSVKDPTD